MHVEAKKKKKTSIKKTCFNIFFVFFKMFAILLHGFYPFQKRKAFRVNVFSNL